MYKASLFFVLWAAIIVFPGTGLGDTPQLPFEEAIERIMAPLEYAEVPVLVRPQVSLSMDFDGRQWTLHNIHEYNGQGELLLEQGRYGLCAELATFVFEKLKPLLSARYALEFAMVTEAGFFTQEASNHIVLLLVDTSDNQVYLIDPSFHRYAPIRDMTGYQVLNVQDMLSFVRDKTHDVSFRADQSIPLYIRKDFLLSFSVTTIDNRFDKDNFIFVISATPRYKNSRQDILFIGRHNKQIVDFEDKATLERLLTPEEIKVLLDKITVWLKQE